MSLVNNEDLSYICLLLLEIYLILVAKLLFRDMNNLLVHLYFQANITIYR